MHMFWFLHLSNPFSCLSLSFCLSNSPPFSLSLLLSHSFCFQMNVIWKIFLLFFLLLLEPERTLFNDFRMDYWWLDFWTTSEEEAPAIKLAVIRESLHMNEGTRDRKTRERSRVRKTREREREIWEREHEREDERKSSKFWFNLGRKEDGNMSYEKQEERKVDEREREWSLNWCYVGWTFLSLPQRSYWLTREPFIFLGAKKIRKRVCIIYGKGLQGRRVERERGKE